MNDSMRYLAPVDAEISERIAWLIQLRWLAVVGTLITITLANIALPDVLPTVNLIAVTAFIGIYNVLFYVYSHTLRHEEDAAKRVVRSVRFAHVQISLDLICLTLLLHYAGGIENQFWPFYVLHVIISSILLSRRAAFGYAGLAIILYLGLIGLEYLGLIPHVFLKGVVGPDRYRRETFLIMTAVAVITTMIFAAMMATTIMARLRERAKELVEANSQLDQRVQELAVLNRRLREMDEARKRFVRLVTHELRSPTAAIQSYLRLILGGYVPPEKQPEILARAERRAGEQLEQINDLLVLSQLQDRQLEASEVDLNEVLGKALETLQGSAQEKKIRINLDVDPGTPTILADRDKMYQIWSNLISNAIKYTPEGGHIEITLTRRPASVIGSVRDTGIGISAEDQARIFEEYFRSEEAKKTERHGTGLGLAIVKRVIEEYGGRIWVNSSPGKGSKFTFVLPRPEEVAGDTAGETVSEGEKEVEDSTEQ